MVRSATVSRAILGVSAFYHDSAAALVIDGEIVAAAQEERFTRKKHDASFPTHAVEYCLREAGLQASDLDYVGFYDKPLLTYGRLLETYLAYAPRGLGSYLEALPLWLKQKLHLPRELRRGLGGGFDKRFIFSEHHESHAASAFFPSPFDEAAILTLDGVGEWATASWGTGKGNRVELSHELRFPHSVGLLYSAFTYYCGFEVNSGEYKLMGLAPYGNPRYVDLILEKLLDVKPDGSFRMDMSYFNYCQGLTMTGPKFNELFGGPPRRPHEPITERHMDIAASIQRVTEEIMLKIARHLQAETGSRNLCLAGGVALNCVGNGRLLREGPFDNIWIQPAAGDAGGALGVALLIWHQLLGNDRRASSGDQQKGSMLGVEYSDEEIAEFLTSVDASYRRMADDRETCDVVADALADGKVVGWFQGKMEYGPRALGSRSILADPRRSDMQSTINLKVKFREGFRPFAPIVLRERAHEYFDLDPDQESPYMLMVTGVAEEKRVVLDPDSDALEGLDKLRLARSTIPAVTHVDGSARVQTIDAERHGLLRALLETFDEKTGCPVLVNTSFNLGWDPIVCTPEDAYKTFMSSDIDVLAMGSFVLEKSRQRVHVTSTNANEDLLGSTGVLHERLTSPCCATELVATATTLVCESCGHIFAITDGIPQLFWPHEEISQDTDVTEVVKAFYEDAPFPNYNDHDSLSTLIEKSRAGLYARRLDETIPYNSSVLEVGCGTGQLSNFLGISCRQVIGTDMCLNSLRLGENFRREQGLSRVRFVQMNLFRPALRRQQFDVILCNGVLHHTADPKGGFERLLPLLKPGGHIVIGLYNTYGRLFTDLRRLVFRLTGGRAHWIDPILRGEGLSSERRHAWFSDQYRHPHESKHDFGEVLGWFDENLLDFVRGIPAMRPDDDGLAGKTLFEAQSRGGALDHFAVQVGQIVDAGQKEGGFFVMIGKKPDASMGPG
jgi:carbamoyltransferase